MESDGGDPDDVLELFGVDGDSDECEGMKVRRTRERVRRRQSRPHHHHGATSERCRPFSDISTQLSTLIIFFRFFLVMFFICAWGGGGGETNCAV